MKYKKRNIIIIVLIAVLLVVLLILSFQKNNKANSVKKENVITIGVLNTPNDVAVARESGLLQKNLPGYKFKFITFDSGVDANKALMSNSIDFATMGDTNGIVALTANIPAKLFFINELCDTNEELVVRDNTIKNIRQLQGKKIATPFASTSHLSLLYLLDKYHLKNKVTILDMDTQNIVASWKRGNIDAAYSWEPTLSQLKKDGKVIANSGQVGREGMVTGNVTLVSKKFLTEHPKECKKIKNTLIEIHNIRKKHFDYVVDEAAKQVGISKQEAKSQIEGTTWPNESYEQKSLVKNGKFLKDMKMAAHYMRLNQTISHEPSESEFNEFVANY